MEKRISLCLLLLVLLPACASVTGRRQYVKVVPQSHKTEIYVDGKNVAKGPSVIHLKREKAPRLKFKTKNHIREKTLETEYRWGQSFAGNAFLLAYAPLGWLIDMISGAAWHVNDYVEGKNTARKVSSRSRLAILPTNHPYGAISDRLSYAVEKVIRRNFPQAEIIDFEDSHETFVELGMDHNYQGDLTQPEENNELIARLAATHFVISRYDEKNQKVVIDIISGYANQKVASKSFTYKRSLKAKTWSKFFLREFFQFFPNTISMGLNNTQYIFDIETGSDYFVSTREKSNWDFVKTLSITNIRHHRKRRPWRFFLQFFPEISLSLNDIKYQQVLTGQDIPVDLEWNFLGVGYGARTGFTFPVGELYIELAPFLSVNYYKLRGPQFEKTEWLGDNGFYTSIGFDTWVSSRWNIRLFSKAQAMSNKFRGASEIFPTGTFSDARIVSSAGINVGYYFFEERRSLRKYLLD